MACPDLTDPSTSPARPVTEVGTEPWPQNAFPSPVDGPFQQRTVCVVSVVPPPLPHGWPAPRCPRCDEPSLSVLPPTAQPRCRLPGPPAGFLSGLSIPGPQTSSRRSSFPHVVPSAGAVHCPPVPSESRGSFWSQQQGWLCMW